MFLATRPSPTVRTLGGPLARFQAAITLLSKPKFVGISSSRPYYVRAAF